MSADSIAHAKGISLLKLDVNFVVALLKKSFTDFNWSWVGANGLLLLFLLACELPPAHVDADAVVVFYPLHRLVRCVDAFGSV